MHNTNSTTTCRNVETSISSPLLRRRPRTDTNPDAFRTSSLGRLAVLDDQLIEEILLQLQPTDLCSAACASTVLHIMCSEEPLWQAIALRRQFEAPLRYMGNWRATVYWLTNQTTKYQAQAERSSVGDVILEPEDAEVLAVFMDRPKPRRQLQSMFLFRRWYRCNVDLSMFEPQFKGLVPVLGTEMTAAMFRDQVESADRPACIKGLADKWPARHRWTINGLLDRCGNAALQVSRPRHCGGKIKMLLKEYVEYMHLQHDEEPLYIFDSDFLRAAPMLAEDYTPPSVFEHDHFCHLRDKRPDHQWLVLGPPRSGAGWHVDPQLTSAWNTLLTGRKRWAAYPPGRVPPGVFASIGDNGEMDFDEPSALRWFMDVYPHIPEAERPLEWVQHPGDTVFIPGGWWHIVLNLEVAIAVTHNFVSDANLDRVTHYMSCGDAAQFLGTEAEPLPGIWCNHTAAGQAIETTLPAGACEQHNTGIVNMMEHEIDDDEVESVPDPFHRMRRRGFLRDRKLGLWLRLLWEKSSESPSTRECLLRSAERHCDSPLWKQALTAVCASIGRSQVPKSHEILPLFGGGTVVFRLGQDCKHQSGHGNVVGQHQDGTSNSIVVKFYCKSTLAASRAVQACETQAYEAVKQALAAAEATLDDSDPRAISERSLMWAELRNVLPHILMHSCTTSADVQQPSSVTVRWEIANLKRKETGIIDSDNEFQISSTCSTADAPADSSSDRDIFATELPFIAIKSLPGEPLSMLRNHLQQSEWHDVAVFLGRNLAAFHSLPMQAACSAFWQEMDDTVVCSTYQHQESSDSQATDGTRPKFQNYKALFKSWATWAPFCDFFTKRRKAMWNTLTLSGLLPDQLSEDLSNYIPENLQALVAVKSAVDSVAGSEPLAMPCLLHGDPTGFNVLMTEKISNAYIHGSIQPEVGGTFRKPSRQKINCDSAPSDSLPPFPAQPGRWHPSALIDLGDAGHGDPLYDIVTLYIDIFRCRHDLLNLFLEAYRETHSKINGEASCCWLDPSQRMLRLPKVAMCYALLHKQQLLSRIWNEHPEAFKASSWFEVEQLVWGPLLSS